MIPENGTITIPPEGGSFTYDVTVINTGPSRMTFDGWIDAILPSGNTYGPITARYDITLEPYAEFVKTDLTQFVPGHAPEGTYTFIAETGKYPDYIIAFDAFDFEKLQE